MAPEVFKRSSKVDAFKSDVFSFGMMCSEIILRKRNFDGVRFCDYKQSIKNDERPKLPQACSEGLKSLIHKCWSTEPSKRPIFLDILKNLRKLKKDAIFKTIHDVVASKPFKTKVWKLGSTTSLSRIQEESKFTLSDQMLHEVNFPLSKFICKASWMYLDQ
jgi:hypothetical protein